MSKINDFDERLNFSHAHGDASWWFEVYRKAFPGLRASVNVRKDGWAQRGGIDRVLTLSSGRTITVDEKVREKVWQDILLERWSDEERKIPGWVQKPLACDFIAYAFVPSATCYLFPTPTLQRAWRLKGLEWIETRQEIRAQNKGYVTVSVAIPIQELLSAISDAMIVTWSADEYDAQADIAGSFEEAYRAIRQRKANGGPGWEPK
jgi:hypothetical protein